MQIVFGKSLKSVRPKRELINSSIDSIKLGNSKVLEICFSVKLLFLISFNISSIILWILDISINSWVMD